MVNTILNYLQGMDNIAVAIRLIIATLCGSLIGWERVLRRHSAGIRTFALVSLGSAVAAVLNLYLAGLENFNADVSRIPAGVVSGIGFLGAGTIIVTGRNQIKGLTTAATLWVASCMGMAYGAGYLTVGFGCFILVIFANVVLVHLSQKIEETSRYITLYVEVDQTTGVKKLRKKLSESGYKINSINKTKDKTLFLSDIALRIELDYGKKHPHELLLEDLNNLDYVNYVEEI